MDEKLKKELARREKEEALLQFAHFSNEDALALGLKIVDKARSWGVAVAVDIVINGNHLFHYAMTGSNVRQAMWVQRKQNMVNTSHVSTLHANQFLEATGKDLWQDWRLTEGDDATFGGGFPITLAGTGIIGAVACSGLPHTEDHRLLVESISEFLNIDLDAE